MSPIASVARIEEEVAVVTRPGHRIAIDARRLRTSTGTYIDRLLAHLQKLDAVNEYTVILDRDDAPRWRPTSPNFHPVSVSYGIYSFAEQLGFKRFLDAQRFDLVHFCMPQQPVAYRGKKVTTFHDLTLLKTVHSDVNRLVFRAKQSVGRQAFRAAARSSRLLLVPSRYTAHELESMLDVDPEKVRLTYEAAEVTDATPAQVALPFERFLLYVGTQSDYKNIHRLAQAHQLLRRSDHELGLVLVGKLDEPAARNQKRFAEAGMQGIEFTGYVSPGQLRWLYEHASVYVFPSMMEGFGLPGLEAMLHGLPVVSSNATCLPEVYEDAAEYFDPADVREMVEVLKKVLGDARRRRELTLAGRRRAAEFSWARMAEQTLDAYREALSTPVRTGAFAGSSGGLRRRP